jgi:hypothetical protein
MENVMKKILVSMMLVCSLFACDDKAIQDNPDGYVSPQKLLGQLLDEGVSIDLDNDYLSQAWNVDSFTLDNNKVENSIDLMPLNQDGTFSSLVTPFFQFKAFVFDLDAYTSHSISYATLMPDGETAYESVDGTIGVFFDMSYTWELQEIGFNAYLRITRAWTFYPICGSPDEGVCEAIFDDDPDYFQPYDDSYSYTVEIIGANETAWAVVYQGNYYLFTIN